MNANPPLPLAINPGKCHRHGPVGSVAVLISPEATNPCYSLMILLRTSYGFGEMMVF